MPLFLSKGAKLRSVVKKEVLTGSSKQKIFDTLWPEHSEFGYAPDEKTKFARVVANYPTLSQRESYKILHFTLVVIIAFTGIAGTFLLFFSGIMYPILALLPLAVSMLFVYFLLQWNGQIYYTIGVLTGLNIYRSLKDFPANGDDQMYFFVGTGINLLVIALSVYLYVKLCYDYSEETKTINDKRVSGIRFKEDNLNADQDILI